MTTNTHAAALVTDVLIVGRGPVGSALSALLGRYGVRTLVIDKASDILMMPRAIALDDEALRILQLVGLEEGSFPTIAIPEVNMHSPFLGHFAKAPTAGSINGHPRLITFYQPDLEHALRALADTCESVSSLAETELLDMRQNADGVIASIRSSNGEQREVHCRFLVGADGASSRVRELIGQEFKGQSYTEDWLIVDAAERDGKAIDHVEFICDPKRPTPHMPAPGGRERWEFMLRPGESREEMATTENVTRLLAPWVDSKDLKIERQAVYRFHARCCNKFQQGRVFLVGDAAHITPPFVGQGLVAGLRDIANLGWKLAWVLCGQAPQKLLDSYDTERRPHAKAMIDTARLMGHLVMPANPIKAVLVHGLMQIMRRLPWLGSYLEQLKLKPVNRSREGAFVYGRSAAGYTRGGQIPQGLVRSEGQICLSDQVIDGMTLVGLGVDPQQVLSERSLEQWRARGGRLLHVGARGSVAASDTPFAEDLTDILLPKSAQRWLVIVRPDRVVLHDGPAEQAEDIVGAFASVM